MPDNSSSNTDQIADDLGGFVFGVSGREYADLAVRAARSLRAVAPDALIDIFTDVDVPDDLFDQVHPLEQSWFRPKFEGFTIPIEGYEVKLKGLLLKSRIQKSTVSTRSFSN